jgi:hypothetical protein
MYDAALTELQRRKSAGIADAADLRNFDTLTARAAKQEPQGNASLPAPQNTVAPFGTGLTAPASATTPAAPGALASWTADANTAGNLATMAGPMQGAVTYTPSDNALVSNNLTKLLASDNPYMTLARTKAKQYANSRGLLNSSMAAGAGERAAIESALPIAQQDASTFFTSERDNAGVQNTFARDANAFGREGALMTAKAGLDMGAQREGQAWRSGEAALDRSLTTSRDATQFANRLTEISAQTDAQIKLMDKQQGTNLYSGYRTASAGINDDYAAAVTRINESDMDPDVKQAQIATLQTLTEQRQTFLNTLYENSPAWSDEWSLFAVAPAEATEGVV